MGSRPRGRCRGKRAFRADVVRIANSVKKPSSHLNPGGISPSSSDSSFRLAEVSGIATLFAATQLPYRKCVQTVSSTARSRPSRKLSTFSNTSSLSCRSMLRCSLSSRFFASECWRRVRGPRVIAAVSFATEGILDEPFDSADRGVPFTRAMSGRAGGRGSAPPLQEKGKKMTGNEVSSSIKRGLRFALEAISRFANQENVSREKSRATNIRVERAVGGVDECSAM